MLRNGLKSVGLCVAFLFMLNVATAAEEKFGSGLAKFVPAGYRIFEEISGDLNKDGLEDYVLVIKGTDRKNIVDIDGWGTLDCNRGGIVVVFNRGGRYELALENRDCFPSYDEDRVFPTELYAGASILKGNLRISYNNDKYRNTYYTFRYQNSDFELIGYDDDHTDPCDHKHTSVNLLSKKMQTVESRSENCNYDGPKKETWEIRSSNR